MIKRTRLKDIAQQLNVSTSLVSAVLNGKSTQWVSEQTRQRIIETAQKLGYHPQAAARTLRSGRTHTVALLYWEHEVVRLEALAQELARAGYRLMVYVPSTPTEFSSILQEIVHSRSADVIALWGSETRMEPYGEYLEQQATKFVVKGRHDECHPQWYQIDFDHEAMMYASVSHLWTCGHRRIAYLAYPLEETYRFHLLKGFRSAYEQLAGIPPDEELICCNVNSIEDAEAIVSHWLSLPAGQKPSAMVITADNEGWYGAERALAKRGIIIGDHPPNFAVSGQCQPDLRLAFGSARAHVNIDLNTLGATLATQLLLPIMQGSEPQQRIVRLLPKMEAVQTQALGYLLGQQTTYHYEEVE